MQEYIFKLKTAHGVSEKHYLAQNLGPLEKNILQKTDLKWQDLICLFLDEEFFAEQGIDSEEKLLAYELSCNKVNGEFVYEYAVDPQIGTLQNGSQIKQNCSHIWKHSLFAEETGMNFGQQQKWKSLRSAQLTTEEILFWTFYFCAWGGYDHPYPYTLYKTLTNCRFEKYNDSLLQEKEEMLYERS